ncbi:MAG: hypothetical protein IKJ68_12730 [Clostridia bacterium]|nr:hypothetical protein [Clostridia bacterium]
MKKSFKSFLASIVAMIMLFGLAVVPVSAADSAVTIYKNDFQNRTAGTTWNSASFPGASSSEMWYPDLSDTAANGGKPTDGANRDPITFFDRGSGDIAMRFGSSKAYTHSYYTQANTWGFSGATFTQGSSQVLNIGIDMMAEDNAYDKKIVLRRSSGKVWNQIINLSEDGNIKVWGQNLCTYNVNTWYALDIWYDFDAKRVFVYLNNNLVKIISGSTLFNADGDAIDMFQITGYIPAGTIGAMCLDNIDIGIISKSSIPASRDEVKGFVDYYYNESVTSADKNYTDSNETAIFSVWNKAGFKTEKGVYGKTADDTSANFYKPESGNVANHNVLASKYMTDNKIVHISQLYAMSANTNSKLLMYTNSGTGTNCNFLLVQNRGTEVYSLGETISDMNLGQWYRFDFILTNDGSVQKADLYMNGQLQYKDVEFKHTLASIRTYLENTSTPDTGAYFDNTLIASYASDGTPIVPQVSVTGSNIIVDGVDSIYVPATYTVANFKANATTSLPFEVRTKAGVAVEDNASIVGNYIVFKPAVGGEIYYEVKSLSTYERFAVKQNGAFVKGNEIELAGGNLSVEVYDVQSPLLYVAQYNESNEMIALASNISNATKIENITIDSDAYKIKIMCFKDGTGIKPLKVARILYFPAVSE